MGQLAAAGRLGASFGREVLATYSQILFSRSPWVGLLLLLASAIEPRAGLGGLLGVLSASATAAWLGLDPHTRREGAYGYNAFLIGLGVAQTFTGIAPFFVLCLLAAPASVVITAALRTRLAPSGLPVISWPFLAVFPLLLAAAPAAGALLPFVTQVAPPEIWPVPGEIFLRALGALFFLPRPEAGALLLCAMLLHSRIAVLLAGAGFGLTWALSQHALSLPPGSIITVLGYNAAFIAMALGGVWFVPSVASFLLAGLGVLLCASFTAGAMGPLARLGLPVMILPFNLVLTLLLLALRQRARDGSPKSVDFLPGTPEENLGYFRTRLLRFRWLYPVRLRLPLRGAWLCTQGVDGQFTHKERWRYAYDFEVRGGDGLLFREDGSQPEHYHAYRLPVLAAAAGTVIKVENNVPDNPVGALNLEENWGNFVLIQHGVGLYSLVAHLLRGSVKVYEGQPVRAGDLLGHCGNSGRSSQPHIHFHLQAGPRLGEGTIPCRFNDVVALSPGGEANVETAADPRPGVELRNLEPGEEGAEFLTFPFGDGWVLQGEAGTEHVIVEVDLYGRRSLRSRELGAVLYYDLSEDFFMIYDVVGDRRSALHLLRAALPRVPLEVSEALRWRDHLPARPFRSWPMRVLTDFVSPFSHQDGIEVALRMERKDRQLVVRGESLRRDRRGAPVLSTRAVLAPGQGPVEIEITVRGRRLHAVRTGLTETADKAKSEEMR